MRQIPLERTANQSLNFEHNESRYELTFKELSDHAMTVDVSENGERIVRGQVCVFGSPLLPYAYMQRGGNFYFDTAVMGATGTYVLPHWSQFGLTCNLYFIPPEV